MFCFGGQKKCYHVKFGGNILMLEWELIARGEWS
jgi:hypothetical protein